MTKINDPSERLIEIYRNKARHYDVTSQLFYPFGPQRAHRRKAAQALMLRPGDSVVEIACGTGLNFSMIEQQIGPDGRIVGVDLTDAMLARARHRIEMHGWRNISLVQADAAEFEYPRGVDAILATYAHSLLPSPREVIAHGAAALRPGGRWVVLDLKAPDTMPHWLTQLGIATVGRSGSLERWMARRPWDAVRVVMQDRLTDLSWTELFFGFVYLAAGSRAPATKLARPSAKLDRVEL